MARPLLTERFMDEAHAIWSTQVKKRLVRVLPMIESFPESGPANIPASLVEECGPTIRRCPMDPYYLIHEYGPESDVAAVLGLVPQRSTDEHASIQRGPSNQLRCCPAALPKHVHTACPEKSIWMHFGCTLEQHSSVQECATRSFLPHPSQERNFPQGISNCMRTFPTT